MSKKIISALLLTLFMVSATGCGDGEETIAEINNINASLEALTTETTTEVVLGEEDQEFLDYEIRLSKGEFTAEDYLAFGNLCKEKGLIRRQRDLLEQSYRLFDDQAAFEQLQEISVNLEEESSEILEEAKLVLQNLELDEYVPEAINQVTNQAWFDTMMPKLYEGKRSYFLQSEGQMELMIEVGYTEKGEQFSKIWYESPDKKVKVIDLEDDVLRYMETSKGEANYEGAFVAWTIDASTGDIQKESGELTAGKYVGEYTIEVHAGDAASDLFGLWSNREGMEYTMYAGEFDENGKTILEQPSDAVCEKLIKETDYAQCLVYAYDENKKNCLFTGLSEGEDKETYAYSLATFGWDAYPTMSAYQVAEGNIIAEGATTGSAEASGMELRIYDGNIQWFNGERWITAGSVVSYQNQDPFNTYAENESKQPENGEDEDGEADDDKITRPSGSVEEVKVTKPATTKPATTTKPTTVTKPATPTPAPTPEPEPEEEEEEEEEDEPAPAPEPEPTPEPEPEPESGDVDVEWTDDIL